MGRKVDSFKFDFCRIACHAEYQVSLYITYESQVPLFIMREYLVLCFRANPPVSAIHGWEVTIAPEDHCKMELTMVLEETWGGAGRPWASLQPGAVENGRTPTKIQESV